MKPAANSPANSPLDWRAKCQKNATKPGGGVACSGVSVGFNKRSNSLNMTQAGGPTGTTALVAPSRGATPHFPFIGSGRAGRGTSCRHYDRRGAQPGVQPWQIGNRSSARLVRPVLPRRPRPANDPQPAHHRKDRSGGGGGQDDCPRKSTGVLGERQIAHVHAEYAATNVGGSRKTVTIDSANKCRLVSAASLAPISSCSRRERSWIAAIS